ncbi:trans-aconitate 2-methyltransferase [Pseudoxanthobacter sp. M-2]|uniref:trans-aconitate 2-methyltransferase n=1 Tax=Pseudoxanthobacter sp. M-2 TaxID=3078754 RepID=UPI0038FC82FA
MSAWSPSLYVKFEDERTRPAADLLAHVPLETARRIIDMGCGPGNSTELLAARFPAATVTGVDSSPEMLAAASKRLPHLAFEHADLTTWMPAGPVHLLYANAVFQWVPDHLAVLVRLMGALAPGGVLAVQMPDNLGEPSHRAMRDTAEAGPWAERIHAAGIGRERLPPVEAYYDALKPFAARVDLWHTHYQHPLAGVPAIVAWLKSTGLRPYLAPLTEAERPAFLADYARRLEADYHPRVDGTVLLRFPRLFIVAVRA